MIQVELPPDTPPELEELICRDAASDPEEEKSRADLAAAIAAFGEGETKEQAAEAAERERRRERRDRRIIERTLAICRGG